MENIRLGGSFFCPRCQRTHSSAMTCDEVQEMKQRNEEFWANLKETTEEEKVMQTQPLFTLTAEENKLLQSLSWKEYNNCKRIANEMHKQYGNYASESYEKRASLCKELIRKLENYQYEQEEV